MTFPSGVASVTVTGQNLVDDAGNPLQGVIIFDAGTIEFAPGGTPPTVFENPAVAQVTGGVMSPVKLPDSHHAFGSTFTYNVTLRFEGRSDSIYTSLVISTDVYPSGTVDIAQLL